MYGNYLMWWVYSATGIYSVNGLIKFLPQNLINHKLNVLRIAGVFSMEIYTIHWVLLLVIKQFVSL